MSLAIRFADLVAALPALPVAALSRRRLNEAYNNIFISLSNDLECRRGGSAASPRARHLGNNPTKFRQRSPRIEGRSGTYATVRRPSDGLDVRTLSGEIGILAQRKDLHGSSARDEPRLFESRAVCARALRGATAVALIAAAVQLGACAAVNPDILASGASGPEMSGVAALAPRERAPADTISVLTSEQETAYLTGGPASDNTVALAPTAFRDAGSIDVLSAEEESLRLGQIYAVPPSAATSEVVIQDQLVTSDEPYDTYGAPPYGVVYVDEGDPLEGLNRGIFAFNDAVDTIVLEPLARTYRAVVPPPIRTSVRSFLYNLESPATFANDLMQGNLDRAETTMARFMFNTIIGVAGLYDFASAELGLHGHSEDFDQTLAVNGVRSGPYLVVPILGPATPRHLVGRIVDSVFHPLTWLLAPAPIEVVLAERAGEGVVVREEVLDALSETKANSTDYYIAIQSLYRQNRASEINNGQLPVDASGNQIDPYEGIDIDL